MKVTRIAYSKVISEADHQQIRELARRLGVLRSEVWNEYGSIKGVGIRHREIRNLWLQNGKSFNVPARLWKETLRDVMNDIGSYREAAKGKVRKKIHRRNKEDQKSLYTALKFDTWITDSFLRSQMRKHFKHGHTSVRNQIVLDSGCYTTEIVDNRACISMMGLIPLKRIQILLSTNRMPEKTLRLILKDDHKIEVHYQVEIENNCVTRPCGPKILGIDKGYTEAFTDSDGDRHGILLGKTLSNESDYLKQKYQKRNKLKVIAEKSLQLNPKKSENIRLNNLGRKKLDRRKHIHKGHVRDISFKAVHNILDKASTVVAEDLSSPIKSRRKQSKDTSRRLSGWVKGLLANALLCSSKRRGATLIPINAAYTSQMDSFDGSLTGIRKGDLFYRSNGNGDVLDADWNAARNILARKDDQEIGLFTPYREVKSILLKRTEHKRLGLLNQDSSCSPPENQQRANHQ